MAQVWSVLFFVAAELLLWSGGAKLVRPDPTVQALRATRFPSGRLVVRILGGIEIAIGVACLIRPSTASAMVLSVLYLGFGAFVLVSLAAETRPSCGCFGSADAPPSMLHLGFDLIAAAAGIAVLAGPRTLLDVAASSPLLGVPFVIGLVVAAYLSVLMLTTLPSLFFSYRRPEA